MADAAERVGVVIREQASSRGRILFVEEFAGNYYTRSALRRSIRCGSLEGSREGKLVST
jgi:hypothetical protein